MKYLADKKDMTEEGSISRIGLYFPIRYWMVHFCILWGWNIVVSQWDYRLLFIILLIGLLF